MNKRILFLLIFLFPLISTAANDVAVVMNYQGTVKDVDGVAINGDGYFKFAIVASDFDSNPQFLWANASGMVGSNGLEPETAVTVPVSNGLFSVKLGDANMNPLNADLFSMFDTKPLYLRVWFSSEIGGTYEFLGPMMQLSSSAFSLRSQVANVAVVANGLASEGKSSEISYKVFTGTTSVTEGGKVFISTGINSDKIISMTLQASNGGSQWLPQPYNYSPGYELQWILRGNGDVQVICQKNNSSKILSSPFKLFVWYEK